MALADCEVRARMMTDYARVAAAGSELIDELAELVARLDAIELEPFALEAERLSEAEALVRSLRRRLEAAQAEAADKDAAMASLSARLEAAERAHAGCGRETAELRRRITEQIQASEKLSRQLQELAAQASRQTHLDLLC